MLIGLSFSRCILDIFEKRVDIDNVLIVIARTKIDPHIDKQWDEVWTGYRSYLAEWHDIPNSAQDNVRAIALQLYDDGKLHQPRQFGAHVVKRHEYWLETLLPSSELERNPAAKKAWDNFQVIAGLTNVTMDTGYH